jgi:hypothetical protein
MHSKDNATQPPAELVLEHLPNGEAAWLRPRQPVDVRYVLTEKGRRALGVSVTQR